VELQYLHYLLYTVYEQREVAQAIMFFNKTHAVLFINHYSAKSYIV